MGNPAWESSTTSTRIAPSGTISPAITLKPSSVKTPSSFLDTSKDAIPVSSCKKKKKKIKTKTAKRKKHKKKKAPPPSPPPQILCVLSSITITDHGIFNPPFCPFFSPVCVCVNIYYVTGTSCSFES